MNFRGEYLGTLCVCFFMGDILLAKYFCLGSAWGVHEILWEWTLKCGFFRKAFLISQTRLSGKGVVYSQPMCLLLAATQMNCFCSVVF